MATRTWTTASEFCASVRDGTHASPKPSVSGRRLVTSKHITGGQLDLSSAYLISKYEFDEINRRSKVDVWDVLITMIGTVGDAYLVTEVPDFAIKNIGLFKTGDELTGRWLFNWLRSGEARQMIAERLAGTTQAYISLGSLRDFPVPLLHEADMRSATQLLGLLDDKIELNRRMNETLEAMAQAIFRDWFVDFGPVRRKLAGVTDPVEIMGGITLSSAAGLASLFPDHLNEDPQPDGWHRGRASDLVEFNPREPLRAGVAAPYSDMSSLPTRGTAADEPILRAFGSGMRFRNGDALLARITPCLENGKGAWVDFLTDVAPVGWGSTEFIVMRSRVPTPAPFGYLLSRDPDFRQHAIQSMTGTSGRQRAQAESLEGWPITVPPPSILEAFGEYVDPLFARITAAAAENRTLAETRDYLLPRLMSGEVRVGEVTQEIAA